MEVSFCLQTLIGMLSYYKDDSTTSIKYFSRNLGVESTILNVSSGAEMSSKGRQLAEHFRTHGTPIMIGTSSLEELVLIPL